ncbi:MAG TPA: hypothetical protein VF857_04875 [Spirochaetota bacterium]
MKYLFSWIARIGLITLCATGCANVINPPLKDASFELRLVAPEDSASGDSVEEYKTGDRIIVEKETFITVKDLKGVQQITDANGSPALLIYLNENGRKKLSDMTAAYIRRKIAVIINGRVVMTPIIMERISGGNCVITGRYSAAEMKAMMTQLTGKTE